MKSKLNNLLNKILRNTRDYGPFATLLKSLSFLMKPFYQSVHYRIYCIELEKVQRNKVEKKGFHFEIIKSNSYDKLAQILEMEEWLHKILNKKIAKKCLCLSVSKKAEIIGFNLISLDEAYIPLIQQKWHLDGTEAWSDQISVKKEYRKSGIATNLRYFAFGELKRRGVKRFYGGALLGNEASLKLARKTGFKEIADIHFQKILGYKKWQQSEVK